MRTEIPMMTVHGTATRDVLVVETDGDDARLTIDAGFAGRDVDEELPISALRELVSGGPQRNHDLLGFALTTDGGEFVTGLVGVGSGNQGFLVRREELSKAVEL